MAQLHELNPEQHSASASEEYEIKRLAIISKLSTLAERIHGHGANEHLDRSHVGDLNYVDSQLQELLNFLSPRDGRDY